MAGQIFIEANEVEIAGLPTGAMHLYLVFRDTNGAEYVIRSGPRNAYTPWFGDMKIETNVPMADSADDRDGETPAERSSTPLDFPSLTDDQAWVAKKVAHPLLAQDSCLNVIHPLLHAGHLEENGDKTKAE